MASCQQMGLAAKGFGDAVCGRGAEVFPILLFEPQGAGNVGFAVWLTWQPFAPPDEHLLKFVAVYALDQGVYFFTLICSFGV